MTLAMSMVKTLLWTAGYPPRILLSQDDGLESKLRDIIIATSPCFLEYVRLQAS